MSFGQRVTSLATRTGIQAVPRGRGFGSRPLRSAREHLSEPRFSDRQRHCERQFGMLKFPHAVPQVKAALLVRQCPPEQPAAANLGVLNENVEQDHFPPDPGLMVAAELCPIVGCPPYGQATA